MEKTRVLFVYPLYQDQSREILALFPENTRIDRGHKLCGCYTHNDQHGEAGYFRLRNKRATKEQYVSLARELENLGYNLDIINESII